MKNAVTCVGFALIIILCVIMHLTLTTKDVTKNEAEASLDNAIEQTLNTMTISPFYTLEDVEEVISEIGNGVSAKLSSNSVLDVALSSPDWTKGRISLKFTETYVQSNGKTGTVIVTKEICAEQED